MKGVGKFGEVMAGEKGKVSYDEVAARLEKIIHSGSQRKPITDFVCRELRKIPHYTWVGIYNVDGSELVLASWSGPSEDRSEEHTSELQSRSDLVCRLLLEKKNINTIYSTWRSMNATCRLCCT